jgi:hypothetical protein
MYALPEDFDPAVFLDHELQRVCFPPYGLELQFAKSISLKVFGVLSLDGESLREEASSPGTLARLTALPGHRIVAASTEGRGTLVLTFEEGQTLRVIEDGDAYECYHLRLEEREIIV